MAKKTEGLLELFLRTNDLARLTEAAAETLGDPLLICDTSYHFLARSSVRGVRDKSWLDGMKRRAWSYELVSRIHRLELDYTGREYRAFVLDSINPDSTRRRRLSLLCIDGVHVGYCFVLEEGVRFDDIPQEKFRQVEAILAKCVCTERSLRAPGGGGEAERILLDLLQGGFEDRRLFLERAAGHELARPGRYRVYCVPTGEGSAPAEPGDLRSRIGDCLPLSWQVSMPGCIAVLADCSARPEERREADGRFAALLAQRGLRAGRSDELADPFYLKRYYEQARTAAWLGGVFEDGRAVIPYEDYKLYDLFLNVRGDDLFGRYGTQTVRRIYEHDVQYGTQYLETVRAYLACGCSVQRAAARLYVHRNTVAYRIGKVKELFGMRFDDDGENYLNYTACLLRAWCDRFENRREK